MNVRDKLEAGRQLITERGIDISAATQAYKSVHPQLNPAQIELGVTLEIVASTGYQPPYTADNIAEQMANSSGAFPWVGPVGNGMTLEYYQGKFREIARERIFLMNLLGIWPEADR